MFTGEATRLLSRWWSSFCHIGDTDSAPELTRAVKDLEAAHDRPTPYHHTSNAYCERTVRKIVEGDGTILEHGGLPSCFWPFVIRY